MDKLRLDHPARWTTQRLLGLVAAAIVWAVAAATPLPARAEVSIDLGVSVGYPPPPLPLEEQPPIPGSDYIWTPGYWAWGDDGYYWVPGFWVLAPFYGALWTPAYWGWFGRVCVFHPGYWARHVGFYGGINYGFGYPGHGYVGGRWGPGGFYYNRAVNQIHDPRVTNVYDARVANNGVINRTSFNGGPGGTVAQPSAQDAAVAREAHVAPVAAQLKQVATANRDPSMRASVNHGAPLVGATARASAANRRASAQAMPVANAQRTLPVVPSLHSATVLRSAGFAPHAAGASQRSTAQVARGYAPASSSAMSHARTLPTYAYRPGNSQVAYQRPAVHAAPASRPVHVAGPAHAGGGGMRH
ncbi:YXWGXW repeat-containing protein [Dyella halodurans]|uniref:YXWGXW repeat-containing protein n=1 Tax=Dyella halodurans TaxID=1920171 RepID=A0ABV9C4P4_9GAMM|nr:YXWGXW repeat-containing protein [Dyella halodurans]